MDTPKQPPSVATSAVLGAGGCIGLPTKGHKHAEMDAYGKAHGMTVVFAAWHTNPEYRVFKTGSLLSKNDKYPSGLVIVDERGTPNPWQAPNDKNQTPPPRA